MLCFWFLYFGQPRSFAEEEEEEEGGRLGHMQRVCNIMKWKRQAGSRSRKRGWKFGPGPMKEKKGEKKEDRASPKKEKGKKMQGGI